MSTDERTGRSGDGHPAAARDGGPAGPPDGQQDDRRDGRPEKRQQDRQDVDRAAGRADGPTVAPAQRPVDIGRLCALYGRLRGRLGLARGTDGPPTRAAEAAADLVALLLAERREAGFVMRRSWLGDANRLLALRQAGALLADLIDAREGSSVPALCPRSPSRPQTGTSADAPDAKRKRPAQGRPFHR